MSNELNDKEKEQWIMRFLKKITRKKFDPHYENFVAQKKAAQNAKQQLINEAAEIAKSVMTSCKDQIDGYLKKGYTLKIGKTSQELDKRFSGEYKDEYEDIELIYRCKNKYEMDELEKQLISYYGDKVENEQIGGGNKSYSGEYVIYVVYNTNSIEEAN